MRLYKPRKKAAGYPSTARQGPIGKGETRSGPLAWMEHVMTLLSRWTNYAGMVFLTALMVVMTVDVILRWIVNRPIRGVNELAEFSMLLLFFLTIAYTQVMKSNISVDILFNKFPLRMQAIVYLFVNLLSLGISVLLLRQAIVYNSYLADMNQQSVILKLPVAPFQFVMVIGFLMVSVVLFLQTINSILQTINSFRKKVKQQ